MVILIEKKIEMNLDIDRIIGYILLQTINSVWVRIMLNIFSLKLASAVDKVYQRKSFSIGPRSGTTKHQAWSGSKLLDTQLIFLKDVFRKTDFEK